MSWDPKDPRPHGADERVTRLLREMYAPRTDPAYWNGLQAAIMSRVLRERGSWWTVMADWFPAGMAAAAAALLMFGFALWQERSLETRMAYEQTLKGSAPISVQTVAPPSSLSEREAVLQFVMSR